ncbi:MAG: bifunctional phosphoribosylaminoimidazolecarboxamide formyltransferase/inosine monophosphate cyclohydrolase [Crocinitomicaceae bacterium]|nr:bifunctional phosphoribosylaminoimidazolecarboxamide formyltransferase/inosine monophosphate cyclohydrolase [Crocinitomicaceae bacterium]|tara:strand:+ start:4127 stop:5668 length:1542 start_codon:yes stop_codon:yes gene_type:complete
MSESRKIKSALISVFNKEGLEPIVAELKRLGVTIYSTGGTQKTIEDLGGEVVPVEALTDYPSILGGRVKTLHPKVFGGILSRRDHEGDREQMAQYTIPKIDLVVVDLYPFEETVASGASPEAIVEKIDIGGIALIRGAAKNHKDVVIIPSMDDYSTLIDILKNDGETSLEERTQLAKRAFRTSSQYDTIINKYLESILEDNFSIDNLNINIHSKKSLRYGENPHQKGHFYGNLDDILKQLHGKELSYNNLLDIDAAVNLMEEFMDSAPTFAILKHNNACGLATRDNLSDAYAAALEGDPVSAFGGVLIANREIDLATAELIHTLFCEVVIAPCFSTEALEILKGKKNRILLEHNSSSHTTLTVRTALNGFLVQDKDNKMEVASDLTCVTNKSSDNASISDMLFAMKIAKHTKSNTIVFAKDNQLIASGTGQTSRVDALKQAVKKANSLGLSLEGSVMASDAFFPFPDCINLASKAGIKHVIQPGGSINDSKSIDACNELGLAMYTTGVRHFRH